MSILYWSSLLCKSNLFLNSFIDLAFTISFGRLFQLFIILFEKNFWYFDFLMACNHGHLVYYHVLVWKETVQKNSQFNSLWTARGEVVLDKIHFIHRRTGPPFFRQLRFHSSIPPEKHKTLPEFSDFQNFSKFWG